jgi:hypothetical protein
VTVEPEELQAARRFVRYQLEKEIANQKGGRMGEFRHTMEYDRQLQEALELLRGTDTQAALFRAAGVPLPQAGSAQDASASSSPGGG